MGLGACYAAMGRLTEAAAVLEGGEAELACALEGLASYPSPRSDPSLSPPPRLFRPRPAAVAAASSPPLLITHAPPVSPLAPASALFSASPWAAGAAARLGEGLLTAAAGPPGSSGLAARAQLSAILVALGTQKKLEGAVGGHILPRRPRFLPCFLL